MKKKLDAKKILSAVQPDKAFWVNNGPVLKSLDEFAASLKNLKPEQFLLHVNRQKNDFAKWISEVVGDAILAQRIRVLKTKEAMAKAVRQRIDALKQLIK